MILGLGHDIIVIDRVAQAIQRSNGQLIIKYFTETERIKANKARIDQKKYAQFAKYWAAKEAVSKAIGTGIRDVVTLGSIEITNDKDGKPLCQVNEAVTQLIKDRFGVAAFVIHISLSDEDEVASAVAILEKTA